MLNIIIICDFNKNSGFGHITRMKSLTNSFNKNLYSVKFIFENQYKKFNEKYLAGYNREYVNFKLKKDYKKLINYLRKSSSNIIIVDSYFFNHLVEEKVYEEFFLVSFDDKLLKHKSHMVINSREDIDSNDFSKKGQVWKTGKKYILIGKIFKNTRNNKNIKKILIHGGGSSSYKHFKIFLNETIKYLNKKDVNIFILCKDKNAQNIIKKKLIKLRLLQNNINFIKFKKNLSECLKNYDLVVGPSGITTYEAIAARVLPVSFPLINDGRDSNLNWGLMGNLLHLKYNEKNNIKIIKEIWDFIFKKYEFLKSNIDKHTKLIRDNSNTISQAIIKLYFNKEKKTFNLDESKSKLKIRKAGNEFARSFLESRNSPIVRKISSNPNHIISFSEHLNWWTNKSIKKFVLLENNKTPLAYHWIRSIKTNRNIPIIVSGWFPDKKNKNVLNSSKIILEHQKMYIKKNYKGSKWIININKKNLFSLRLNKSIGFVKTIGNSKKIAKSIFKIDLSKFNTFEMRI